MLSVLELFAGIGGCAEALRTLACGAEAVRARAIDISTLALEVYRRNHPHPATVRTLESLPDADWDAMDADLWWLSPPCQPYTYQGRRRDLADARAAAFVAVLRQLSRRPPLYLALENVPGFVDSQSHAALRETLQRTGYTFREHLLCPTDLGWPMRRRRYYLVASRGGTLRQLTGHRAPPRTLRSLLELAGMSATNARWQRTLDEDRLLERHHDQLHVLDVDDPREVARCFTSAYGKSPLRSGSYLRDDTGAVRHLTPTEVLCLMGFTASFRWPEQLTCRQAWSLAGNSLSIPVVRHVLASLPSCDFV